jgi:hypothetical protein
MVIYVFSEKREAFSIAPFSSLRAHTTTTLNIPSQQFEYVVVGISKFF